MNNLSDKLLQIGQLTQTIISQPHDPLYQVIDQGDGILEVIPTELAISIENTVEYYLYEVLEQFPIHDFHPFVSAFIRNALVCNLQSAIEQHRALKKTNNLYQIGFDYEVMLDLMTKMRTCVKHILEVTESQEIKQRVYNAHRVSKKKHEGMMRYIDSLFEHYSRLLVVRIDLHYHQGNAISSRADITKKYYQVKHDFRHLLNNMKMNQLFDPVVGYIWSLEYGPEKGFHYHLFLFVDGSLVRDDVYFGWQVCEYWEFIITESRGYAWNCNARKKEYRQCGIGTIHYSEVEKINYLKQAAAYLVKIDYYVRMLTSDNGRIFGRGEILPPRTESVGRPRAA